MAQDLIQITKEILDNSHLTSRSAIESYQKCPRKRYLNYLYKGKGIVPARKNVPLTTGSCIHKGVEFLLARLKNNQEINTDWVDVAVNNGRWEYVKLVDESGLAGKGTKTPEAEQFTVDEQLALTEALIRSWAITELPKIQQYYKVIEVEREEFLPLLFPTTNDNGVEGGSKQIIDLAKVDAILEDRKTGDWYNYQVKSVKQYTWNLEKVYKNDLQTLVEVMAVEGWMERRNREIVSLEEITNVAKRYLPNNKAEQLTKFIFQETGKISLKTKLAGTKFCFLIKGRRDEIVNFDYSQQKRVGTGIYKTESPLIAGYYKITPGGILYAHSNKVVKPENKSGFGLLGKGWEKFNVWESSEIWQKGVKGWIEAIASGEIQKDLGDVIKESVVTPPEYFRHEDELANALKQVSYQERKVFDSPVVFEPENVSEETMEEWLQEFFPQYKHSCVYPSFCEFNPVCWQRDEFDRTVSNEVVSDPIGSRWYEFREGHHEAEMERLRD